ncbi:hypothetical protein [Oligoflexus tunisiensis]|uniref:hypothetical protein n=1 Tax=Oligoflexus tunisiensis TaxID=708132 RepID=UPI00114CD8FE|nr:hypothetical protein [Oligoflexus tunisiensis]
MLKTKLVLLSLPCLLMSHLSFAGNPKPNPVPQDPGQQDPGQQDPGQQDPGQQDPGQQGPDKKVFKYPEFGVELGVLMHHSTAYVYVHRLMHEFGTLARLGLHDGDIIYSIAHQKMMNPSHVADMMDNLEAQRETFGFPMKVHLTIARGGQWYSWEAEFD